MRSLHHLLHSLAVVFLSLAAAKAGDNAPSVEDNTENTRVTLPDEDADPKDREGGDVSPEDLRRGTRRK